MAVMQLFAGPKTRHKKYLIAGIDEAGRGPLAGPVTAACVCLPEDYQNDRITDSKKLSPQTREELFPEIQREALAWAVVSVGPRRIETLNILAATKLAMRLAAERTVRRLDRRRKPLFVHLLIDGNARLETSLSHETIVKGDEKILCIGAASILAKVVRDRLMQDLCKRYPGYEFSKHKGYGTEFHRGQIQAFGPSRAHRRTFAGVAEYVYSSPKSLVPEHELLSIEEQWGE